MHGPCKSGITGSLMVLRPAFFGGTLRLAAVGMGCAAVAILLQRGRAERVSPPVLETPATVAAADPAAPTPHGTWAVRAGGWYIRVDGAEVGLPSVAELTASRPRASLAVSISPFDQLIVYHAKAEGFDWRLIAALIFEESRFDPNSRSDKGAVGLMQVRPIAAEAVGAGEFKAPYENVQTGVKYLRQLDDMFADAKGRERLGIVLAAYNIGPGHVRDAQALARRFGYDPNRWEDGLDIMLPLLEQPSIYKLLPNGFAKGHDTVAYVQRILDRYQEYRRETGSLLPLVDDALSSSESLSPNG